MAIRLTKTELKKLGIVVKKEPAKRAIIEEESEEINSSNMECISNNDLIHVKIKINPRPKQRARVAFDKQAIIRAFNSAKGDLKKFAVMLESIKATAYTPEETKKFEESIKLVAKSQIKREPFSVPVFVEILIKFQGKENEWPTDTKDGDVDNIVKAICDSLNNVAYIDDRIVVKKEALKICAEEPGIEIKIYPAKNIKTLW